MPRERRSSSTTRWGAVQQFSETEQTDTNPAVTIECVEPVEEHNPLTEASSAATATTATASTMQRQKSMRLRLAGFTLLATAVGISSIVRIDWESPWWEVVDMFGAVTGIATVALLSEQSMYGWPMGVGNTLILVFSSVHYKMYALAGQMAVFHVLTAYGWYSWLRSADEEDCGGLVRTTPRQWLVYITTTIVGSALGGLVLKTWTDDPAPFLDASLTVVSLIAQWMLVLKQPENWPIWVVSDLVYALWFVLQSYWAMACMYAVFTLAAVNGLRLWERDLSHEAAGLVLVSVPCALEPILQAVAESKKTVQRVHLVLFAAAGSEEETQQIESAVLDANPANMDGDANSISVGVQELGELQTTSQSDQTSGLVRELQKQRIYAPQHIWMLAETHQVSADAIAAVSQSMNCWQRTLSATLRLCYTSPNIQQPTITRSNI